jgi:hypothetical protein
MSEFNEKQGMTRAEVFAELVSRGADRAVVEFSGGNDEGGPDSITLFAGQREVSDLSTWPTGARSAKEQAEDRLADALSEPVFNEYHTFAGDFDVTGEVIWRVQGASVMMIKDERAEYEHSEELV